MNDFTIVLPIKGTLEEMNFIEPSIKSAYALEPGELILALDKPSNPTLLAKLDLITQSYRGDVSR